MSPYELFASIADPIIGPHVDRTVLRTLCSNYNNRLCSNYYYHLVRLCIGREIGRYYYQKEQYSREGQCSFLVNGSVALTTLDVPFQFLNNLTKW